MGVFDTIARILGGGRVPKAARAYIIPIDISTDQAVVDEIRCLQYWPETISDSKQTNWQAKDIPGLSHPLYQWTSGGPREISFSAVLTRDTDIDSSIGFNLDGGEFAQGREGQGFGKRTISRAESELAAANKTNSGDIRNVDIPGAIAYLRQFMYPNYRLNPGSVAERALPPRKLILVFPGVRMNHGNPGFSDSEVPCIMTQCDVSYEAFFPSGTPRVAHISLAFAEIIQTGKSVRPQDAGRLKQLGTSLYTFNPNSKKV